MKNLKKRIVTGAISLVCAAGVMVTLPPAVSVAAAATAQTTDYLNLREGAGLDKKVILTLSKGVTVTVLDSSNATWAKIQTSGGKQGYCSKQYLSISGTSAGNTGSAATGTTAVTTASLNMREGAGTSNKIIVTLSKGTSVKVIDSSNSSWLKVQTADGKQGYCSKEFLSVTSSSGSGNTSNTGSTNTGSTTTVSALTTDYLNLREGAGSNYKVILTISKGTTVKVLDNSNAQWAKVQTSSGKQGYCSKQYLNISTSGGTTTNNPPATGTGTTTGTAVTTSSLNMRSGAGTTYGIVATLAKGVTVTVTDNSNSVWTKIKTSDGKEGYCSKQYLNISMSGGTTTNNPPATGTGTTTGTAVTTASLNVRSGAGTNYSVIVTLAKGVTLTVTDNSNASWAKIKTSDGKEGYCSKEFLNITLGQDNTGSNNGTEPNTDPGTGTGSDDNADTGDTGSDSHTITGASVTADMLRLRESPDTSGKILANLPKGTSLTVLDTSNSAWTKVQTASGVAGYVSSEYIQIHYSDDTTNTTALSLSTTSQSIPVGKTLYIQANISPSGTYINWTSSNPNVATVSNGYVYAVSNGTALITAKSGTYTATCNVTVTNAEPVKTAFASPNIASTGATVTLTAVTDTTRDGVQFVITMPDGSQKALNADSFVEESKQNTYTKKWTATTTFSTAGTYSFTAYSSLNGSMSSTGYTTNAYVSNQQDFITSSSEERRASDQMISLIAKWEGYSSTVYADQLTSNQVPTIGYGCTFGANAVFYNNMTETEAWSLLVNKINNSSYTSELNKMIQNNHFLMNQNQADCLISFAYNVGAGYFNSTAEMDFRRIMKNAVVPPALFSGETLAATVTKDTIVRDQPSIGGGEVCSVISGTSLLVTECNFANTKDGWYRVQLSDGSTGWVNSGYINLSNSDSLTHDLNYTNASAFGSDLIRWNQAGGKFYTGLFYRRLGEANVYNYGDYEAVKFNRYNYTYPNAAAGLS
ncbi:SH3 domain-containing protein [Caproiciproducens faecalis]|uniref:Lysozyme n=1 Tax=Caproiciproducens faecalis TaxID=2820301 RepID=A0ABS7DQE4_9FIRM|nr:SH3 domain-containing protein [Caproiciproducens faecalis]MBW7573336.1 SH3 domain-containing protein [Caproiciproducens faecalis]